MIGDDEKQPAGEGKASWEDRKSQKAKGSRYTPLPNPTGSRSLVGVLPATDAPMTTGRTIGQ